MVWAEIAAVVKGASLRNLLAVVGMEVVVVVVPPWVGEVKVVVAVPLLVVGLEVVMVVVVVVAITAASSLFPVVVEAVGYKLGEVIVG